MAIKLEIQCFFTEREIDIYRERKRERERVRERERGRERGRERE